MGAELAGGHWVAPCLGGVWGVAALFELDALLVVFHCAALWWAAAGAVLGLYLRRCGGGMLAVLPPVRGMMLWGAGRFLWRVGGGLGAGVFLFPPISNHFQPFGWALALGVAAFWGLVGGILLIFPAIWLPFWGVLGGLDGLSVGGEV